MSKYSEKLFNGKTPTDSDWAEHLIEAHKIAPSMTPYAFAPYKTKEGKNSYEILAESLPPISEKAITVVDLACGDGHLIQYLLPRLGQDGKVIGVDMSEAELAIATKAYRDPRIQFHCAKAQTLPIKDQTVDVVLSHMAFMLMLPVEPVVAELARVLKPAGKFSAVIGNPKGRQGLFGDMMKVAFQFMDSRHPKIKEAKSGDSRVNSEEGLSQLFRPDLGFSKVSAMDDFELFVDIAPNETWDWVKDMYFIGMLPESEKALLKEELITFARAKSDSTGRFKFSSPMRKFFVEKSAKPIAMRSTLEFIPYSTELAHHFSKINEEWITEMFVLEDSERAVLENPQREIIDPGGYILFVKAATHGIIGTGALRKTAPGEYELTKMGVLKSARGLKAGEFILQALIAKAKDLGATNLYLLTNKKCEAAIHLYEKNGFSHDEETMTRFGRKYERANVAMRYTSGLT